MPLSEIKEHPLGFQTEAIWLVNLIQHILQEASINPQNYILSNHFHMTRYQFS